MKSFKKRAIAYLCVITMLAGLFAAPAAYDAYAAKKVKLSKKKVTLNVGAKVRIKVKNANNKAKVTWKITKKAVAKIAKKSGKGKKAYADIVGVSAGTAKVTATYKFGKTRKKLTCKVTVSAAEGTAPSGQTAAPTGVQGGQTGAPSGSEAPKGTDAPADPNKSAAPGTDAPTLRPTATPRVTRTPSPTNTPSPTPLKVEEDKFPAVTNARATIDLSSFEVVAGGGAYDADNKRVTFNDGETGANSHGAWTIPSNISINDNDLVTFRVQGFYYGTAPFRFWIGTAISGACTPVELTTKDVDPNRAIGDYPMVVDGVYKNQMKLDVDPTTKAFDVTFTFKAGVSQNDTDSTYSRFTIKYVFDENENGFIDGLSINHIYVVPTENVDPNATAAPTATPGPTVTPINVPDVSGELTLSGVTGDAASYNSQTGQITINDTSDANSTAVFIPLPGEVLPGEKVTVHLKGSTDGTCDGFRVWVGDGVHSGTVTPKRLEGLTAGSFDETFELTAMTEAQNAAQNDDARMTGTCNMLTIKSLAWDGPKLTGITIDSIDITYTERSGATTPTTAPGQPTVAPGTAAPTSAPGQAPSKPVDLSVIAGDSVSYATYNSQNGSVVLNDTSGNTTVIWFPLPETIDNGETVSITLKGSCDSTCSGFRVWIGNGVNSHVQTPQMINNLTAGTIERTFSLTADDTSDMLTIKSTAWDAGSITGLTINSIVVTYTDRVETAPGSPTPPPSAAPGDGNYKWLTTWGTAEEKCDVNADRMPQMSLPGTTVREMIKVTTSGDIMRLKLSNQYGGSDVVIGSMHIAKQVQPDKSIIDTTTDTVVKVNGSESFTIPRGKTITTDPVEFSVDALDIVAVSMYFTSAPSSNITGHRGARSTTYQMSGNNVSTAEFSNYKTTTSWFFLADVSLWTPGEGRAVVCFGDSITDGYGTDADYLGRKPDQYTRWTDYFAQRLQANPATKYVSVINEGIGANGMIGSYPTDSGRNRFSRDLTDHDGVEYCIILFGVNDLNNLGTNNNAYNQLQPEFATMVTKCHNAGIKCYGAPILPFGTSSYYSTGSESARTALNNWMRDLNQSKMDGIIPFDQAVADPDNPKNILEAYTHSDGLHPYDGYDVMANAIDLTMFEL